MTTERRSGAAAEVSLQVGSGDYVAHDGAAARGDLASRRPLPTVARQLAGGYGVDLPLLARGGSVTWVSVRTVTVDQQLYSANQKTGNVRVRPRGTGSKLPQIVTPVVIRTRLLITNAGLCLWSVTATASGASTVSEQ